MQYFIKVHLLLLLSKIYAFFVKTVFAFHQKGLINRVRVSPVVISIGNLSMGGTGKTPMAEYICSYIKSINKSVCIIGRGYRKKQKGTVVVSDGKSILSDASASGDEMLLLAEKCSVPVVADEKKYRAAQFVEKKFNPDCIILDDGFQHHRLYKDFQILILDKKTIFEPYLFPKGTLREPFAAINRADLILIPSGLKLTENQKNIINSKIPVLSFTSKIAAFTNALNGYEYSTDEIKQMKCISLCGIARPERFIDSLKENGVSSVFTITKTDHFSYGKNDVLSIIKAAEKYNTKLIITTEKDYVKLKSYKSEFVSSKIEIVTAKLKITVIDSENILPELISSLFK